MHLCIARKVVEDAFDMISVRASDQLTPMLITFTARKWVHFLLESLSLEECKHKTRDNLFFTHPFQKGTTCFHGDERAQSLSRWSHLRLGWVSLPTNFRFSISILHLSPHQFERLFCSSAYWRAASAVLVTHLTSTMRKQPPQPDTFLFALCARSFGSWVATASVINFAFRPNTNTLRMEVIKATPRTASYPFRAVSRITHLAIIDLFVCVCVFCETDPTRWGANDAAAYAKTHRTEIESN